MLKSVWISFCVVFGLAISAHGQEYLVTDLGSLGGDTTEVHVINNSGQIVGYSTETSTGGVHPFIYADAVMTKLETLGGTANSINNRGQIVGSATFTSGAPPRAFLYDKGSVTDIGIGDFSAANDINDSGTVVGHYFDPNGFLRGFRFRQGETVDLGGLGGTFTQAYGINNAGQITGQAETASSQLRAFLYEDGVMLNLGTLGGSHSQGMAINNAGLVVGGSTTPTEEFRAFGYLHGVMFDLGSLGGFSFALGVNDDGDVVGVSAPASGGFSELKPVLFTNGQVVDLSVYLPGLVLPFARSINANGEIVGDGFTPTGERRGFLLTPVD